MPESRKRPGHPYRQPPDIPASQRVKGKILWAIFVGVIGLLIAYTAAGPNYIIMIAAASVAAIIGYFIGKKMVQKD